MAHLHRYSDRGFTFVELVISLAVFVTLIAFASINLLNVSHNASLSSALDELTADIKDQQLKAMLGDTEGTGSNTQYGVYLGTTTYTLFHGGSYSSTDPANFVRSLGGSLQFVNVTFPQSQIVFDKGNGDIHDFSQGTNTITIQDTQSQKQKTVTLNKYGVITAVN